jgi:hypothetical protein
MKTCFVLLTIILIAFRASGQETQQNQWEKININLSANKNISKDAKRPVEEKDIAGTQYLDKNFQKSYMLKIDGTEIKDILLRLNVYSGNMEFVENGTILAVSFPSEIHRIKMGDKVFVFRQYLYQNKIRHSYFQVLYEGDYQLFKKYVTTLKIPEKSNRYDSLRFVTQAPEYYIRHGEGRIYQILSQKQLIKILQPIHQAVIDYITTNRISAKDEEKLIRFMDFLEENSN